VRPQINQWQQKATTSETALGAWWDKTWPDANIGIATGRTSNLFVLDVDGAKGETTLNALIERYGPLPDTLTAITGRGKHFYFLHPADAIKTSAGSLGEGLDTRADGGYMVAPPSRHSSGNQYSWDNPDTPMQEPPAWLIGLLSGEKKVISIKPEVPFTFHESDVEILEGTRNDTLYKRACALRGQGADQEQIEEHIVKLNEEKCNPPLDEAEVEQIAASAAKHEPGVTPSLTPRTTDPLWWFRFDVNQWCADQHILAMTDYQRGWYISLLAGCWKNAGYLPSDPVKLARIARADDPGKFQTEMQEVLWGFEVCDNEVQIVHSRLNADWNEKVAAMEQCSNAGKKSAASRAEKAQRKAA
jgi:uncharacterized protein YdaU (DUF1376 family)